MLKTLEKEKFEILEKLFKQHNWIRAVVYAAGGLAALYLLGKSFSIVATAVHGYKDLTTAMKR